MKIVKKVLTIIYNILFVVLIIIAGFIILTSFNVIKGYKFYVVLSGSMEPAIHTGSIVTVKEETSYQIGDVITVKSTENPNQTYTHRIANIETLDGVLTYTTKGDANESTDPDVATADKVVGKELFSIPLIGYVVNFTKQPLGFILMIVVPAVIIISSETNNIKGSIKGMIEKKKLNSEKESDEEKD